MDEIHESSPREIRNSKIIGKIIFSILLIFVFTFLGTSFDLHLDGNLEGDSVYRIFWIIKLFIFIILLILYIKKIYVVLIYNRKSKYEFVNYEIHYHPFYKIGNLASNLSESALLAFCAILGGMVFIFMRYLLGITEEKTLSSISSLLIYISHIFLYLIWTTRIHYLNSFPVEILHKHKIRIIFEYEDYLNNKIIDNEPKVYVGQDLRVSTIELPRDEKEKNSVKLFNDNTLDKPALITTINDENLRSALENGYTLEAKIVNFHDFAKLEIEFYLRNDNIQFIEIDPDYEIKF